MHLKQSDEGAARGCGLLVSTFAVLIACSDGSGMSSGGSGGAADSGGTSGGGVVGAGGIAPSGGSAKAGGASGSGGRAGTGGDTASGGMSSGGTSSAGGARTGGTAASGGRTVTGGATAKGGSGGGLTTGATTGGKTTGGPGSGGSAFGTGGKASGGALGSGGATAAGGSTGSACNAVATVANMRLGWNLGNTLDSVDASKSDLAVETAWGNPAATAALMKAVAATGFGAVRIPVTWIGRFGAAPNYAISATFIKRVEEVVGYVLDQKMYAIINLHHDGGYNVNGRWINIVDSSGKVTSTNTNAVLTQFKAVWAQIASHFEDHGDHLIFEGMNEVMVDYGTPKPEYYDVINALNQAFVDTVRAGAGFNPNRCLVVPGYNTNIDYTVAGFVTPKDNGAGKLILSDHYYDPYSFSGEASTHTWGAGNPGIDNWAQEDHVRAQVAKLKSTFIDKGLPMIVGEYGAVNQAGYENYRRYYVEYVTKAMHDAGIAPFVWDNGSSGSGSEGFGLINRSSGSVVYPPIMDALKRAVTSSYTLADVAKP